MPHNADTPDQPPPALPATRSFRPQPRLLSLAWPLFTELGLGIALGLVGMALAAAISDAAGAAFALANHVSAMLFILFRIIGAGASVVLTQSLGAGRRDTADAVARAVLGASSWIGLITALAAWFLAAPLLRLLNAPPEVLPLAQPFLQTLAPALLLDAWNASMSSVMRAHLRSREALGVVVLMHALHLLMAWPLMQGWGPLPALGLPGFAVALGLSRAAGLCLHLLLWRARLDLRPQRSDWWRLPRAELAAVLHIGLPGAAENIAYRLAFMVSVAVAALWGAGALATHAYVSQLMYGVLLFGLATGFAVEIVVGHLIGAGQLHAANRIVRRALARGLVVSVLVALSAALAGPWLLGRFTSDAQIIRAGTQLLWLTVLLEPGRTFNLVVINALRAAGDARYPVLAGAASMVLVLAGGAWFLGAFCGLGLPGIWLAYALDEWIRGLLMWRRWNTLAWVPMARAAHRRLRAA
ncbi:MATE family efflux transporter [Paucibacter sp. DJ1R-11]|uniref:MATE family efflux transporter n=1 Tax=Paucibacter sp. DJ1R-11 TaxID=2893556 RepID=UPI0021E3E186|nr:MATE family efflux transporter [Paucibacter sp. DJ1R-11]MCV2365199.1 MATE family efflux transporter [Paucibacter sp. DJ1R-11]